MPPPEPTVLDALADGRACRSSGVGKISDIFAGRGITENVHTEGNADGMRAHARGDRTGSSAGWCSSTWSTSTCSTATAAIPPATTAALQEFDAFLPRLQRAARARRDLVIITADHGNDPDLPRHRPHARVRAAPRLRADARRRASISASAQRLRRHRRRPWPTRSGSRRRPRGASFLPRDGLTVMTAFLPRAHPTQARRRRARRRRDPRVHRRRHRRLDPRLPGRRDADGDLLPRPRRRASSRRWADAMTALGRRDRPVAIARAEGRQALDRRRRRQDLDPARAGGRGVRRRGADGVGPRPRPHRRHARQARVDPGLPRRPARSSSSRELVDELGVCLIGQTDADRAGRQAALRAARRDRRPSSRCRSSRRRSCRRSSPRASTASCSTCKVGRGAFMKTIERRARAVRG